MLQSFILSLYGRLCWGLGFRADLHIVGRYTFLGRRCSEEEYAWRAVQAFISAFGGGRRGLNKVLGKELNCQVLQSEAIGSECSGWVGQCWQPDHAIFGQRSLIKGAGKGEGGL